MRLSSLALLVFCLTLSSQAFAHFGMVIPSTSVIEEKGHATLNLELSFSHPMEAAGMPLARPKSFQVFVDGRGEDLGATLQPVKIMEHEAWKAQYTIKRPDVYQFVMVPQPYWEPAEDCFIIHYTKTYVAAFGEEKGWDAPVGLKTEIVPLTRPFGLYAGNVYSGQVLLEGKPVPCAEVEIEYYNREKRYAVQNAYLTTQVIKADANGVFTYGMPFAGWWGFAALNTAEEKLFHDGEARNVELGAVVWIECFEPLAK